MSEPRLILTTFSKEADATMTIRALLADHLIACGTLIHRARSIYRWEGRIEDAEEIVVLLKTTATRAEAAARRLRELHPYACPEVLSLEATSHNPEFAAWLTQETAPPSR